MLYHPSSSRSRRPDLALLPYKSLTPQLAADGQGAASHGRTTVDWRTVYDPVSGATEFVAAAIDERNASWFQTPGGLWIKGVRLQPQRTNLFAHSTAIEGNWTKNDAGDTASGVAVDTPFGAGTGESWIASTTVGFHYWQTNLTQTASGHVAWVVVRAGAGGKRVSLYETGVSGGNHFNLITGQIDGAMGGGVTFTRMVSLGDGWYLCLIGYTAVAGVRQVRVYMSDAAGSAFFAGDGSTSQLEVAHAQAELGLYASTPIMTVGFGVARDDDDPIRLSNPFPDAEQGSIAELIWMPKHTPSADIPIWTINDGGASSDQVQALITGTTGYLKVESASSGGNAGAVSVPVNLCDGEPHTSHVGYIENNLRAFVDGTPCATVDTSCDFSASMERLQLEPFGGIHGQLQFWRSGNAQPRAFLEAI